MAERPTDIFRLRLNCVDHYQNAPSSLDPPIWGPSALSSTQRGKLPLVPVIRVFGATENGQKVCAHVHGAFPYLFIQYSESTKEQDVAEYIDVLRHSIDHALALSYRRNPYDDPRKTSFVAHISLVKGVPFFGYNVGYKHYLKVYLLNPAHMTRFTDLLQQGAILKRVFQPFEAHLQYLLQWMCDFNLYGCAYIEASKVAFRTPVPVEDELRDPACIWHDKSIGQSQLLDEASYPRQSHCDIEVDIRVEDIINRHSIRPRDLHHSFIERLASLENLPPQEKLVHSMAGLWKDETQRRKRRMGITNPGSSPFPPEVLVSMSADPRNDSDGGWIHEAENRELVDELAKQERKSRGDTDIDFESFANLQSQQDGVQTVLESVEELFQARMAAKSSAHLDRVLTQLPEFDARARSIKNLKHQTHVLVDIGSVAQVADDDDYGSDEEVAKLMATQRQKSDGGGFNGLVNDAARLDDSDETASAGRVEQLDGTSMSATVTIPIDQASRLKRAATSHTQGRFKRVRVGSEEERPQSRHIRFEDVSPQEPHVRKPWITGREAPPSSQRAAHIQSGQDTSMLPSVQPLSSQHSSQSSQTVKFSFPVVKHGREPETLFQIGQRNAQAFDKDSHDSGKSNTLSSDSFSKSGPTPSAKSDDTDVGPFRGRPKFDIQLAANYAQSFRRTAGAAAVMIAFQPPTYTEVEASVSPQILFQDAYYSNEQDVPDRPREYAGQEFRLESLSLPFLPPFDKNGAPWAGKNVVLDRAKIDHEDERRQRNCTLKAWEFMQPPPSHDEVLEWLHAAAPATDDELESFEVDGPPAATQVKRKNPPASELSQIDGPTQRNKHGFKFSQRKASTSVQHETGYMSTMSLEVHINSRGDLAPDPERDEIAMIVWCIADERMEDSPLLGISLLSLDDALTDKVRRMVGTGVQVHAEDTELDLINHMVDVVREYDPDILTGFEVHNNSWGYLIERARLQYEFNLPNEFSRMKAQSHGRFGKDADRWGFTHTSTVRITGRHTINIWRAMRSELNLLQYTMENVTFHLLHKRVPHYSFATLTGWYQSGRPRDLNRVVNYFVSRTKLDLELLDANELIPRTSEQARLLGVDFFSVFSRGSQYKVESLMFRIAKPESFLLVSPSRKQVGAQNALECLPLVMEPQSAFYSSPLLVLDFQSLYPSVMIAYNYCYSTCLGRITNWRGTNKMGFADFQRTPGLLELVKDKLNIAPNGMMYVKPEMRKSLLAKMLGEILETQVMVKSGMKVDKNDKTLQQLLNNRQLALKLIANVTYGYTSASFSGRMPCSEIADSIVQTGRETLEKAIALIHSIDRWGAEVVYGDTDSLFVYLKGRSRDDAFKIGDEIAKAVTDLNPRPVKLKFEKVYHPCVLLAKKRYVGFKYESPKQTEPEFDAKGIETVRRDGTPAEQKIEEKALKLLFRTADLSQVKSYFQTQCTKIMSGRFSIQDFCFAKEVKLGTYADKGPPPPGALIATKRMLRDPRTEPQYGERIPYIVIAGAPGAKLYERCVEPERLIHDEHAELDAEYYISKNLIPPLERIFNLVGANVRHWYDDMPKVQRIRTLGGPRDGELGNKAKKTMESYMGSSLCLVCRTKLPPIGPYAEEVQLPLCDECKFERTQKTVLALRRKLQKAEVKARDMHDVCRSCADLAPDEEIKCDSRDCPVFYSRVKADTQLNVARSGVGKVVEALEEEVAMRPDLEW